MIETHVVNALLAVHLKNEAPFKALTFLNGLVAPVFLFCAGFAFAVSVHRKWQQFTALNPLLWRYVVRLVFILVVAYSLHIPFFSLHRMSTISDDHLWTSFFQVDILQVIAVTLLFQVLLVPLVRKEDFFIKIIAGIGCMIIFATPLVWSMDLSSLPIWFRSYLSTQFRSQFPLFPWSAFLLSGTILGYRFNVAHETKGAAHLMRAYTLWSVGAIALSVLVESLPMTLYPNHDFWQGSPEFFFVRLALVVLCCVCIWGFEQKRPPAQSSIVILFGQESLLVYVVHLLVVYGYTYEWSFARKFGPTLNYLECLGLFVALTLTMYVMAYVWHTLKHWNIRVASLVQFAVLAGIVVEFIVK